MAKENDRALVLYGTCGCHLCELAEGQLLPWVSEGWQVELVDIAETDALLERFSLMIPVLERVTTGQLLCWPFGQRQLQEFLQLPPSIQEADR
ncbi:MAG TPA: glutaredoxin family protein [Pseudomonadales bacterium]|nr:glutaredoxin family protein [Pseudomonadales bacterium]